MIILFIFMVHELCLGGSTYAVMGAVIILLIMVSLYSKFIDVGCSK